MLLTLASLLISLVILAAVAWLAYGVGRSVNIHRSHKPCVEQGRAEGFAQGEAARDQLTARVVDLENQLDATRTERNPAEAEIQTWRRAATDGIQQMDAVLGTDTVAIVRNERSEA